MKAGLLVYAYVALVLASCEAVPVGLIHFGQFPVGVSACVELTFG